MTREPTQFSASDWLRPEILWQKNILTLKNLCNTCVLRKEVVARCRAETRA